MIEPAAYGMPVCFGPRTENFQAVVDQLLESQAAQVVHDEQQLMAFVDRAISDKRWSRDIGERARTLVGQQQGATDRTITRLCGLLNDNSKNESRAA